eukprot:428260_1
MQRRRSQQLRSGPLYHQQRSHRFSLGSYIRKLWVTARVTRLSLFRFASLLLELLSIYYGKKSLMKHSDVIYGRYCRRNLGSERPKLHIFKAKPSHDGRGHARRTDS